MIGPTFKIVKGNKTPIANMDGPPALTQPTKKYPEPAKKYPEPKKC